jgi:hypothetical protein
MKQAHVWEGLTHGGTDRFPIRAGAGGGLVVGSLLASTCRHAVDTLDTSYQHCQRYEDATLPHSSLGRRCFHEVKSQLSEASVGRGEGPFRGVAALSPALPGSCGCL